MGLQMGACFSEDRSSWEPGGRWREMGTLRVPVDDGGQEAQEELLGDGEEGQQPQVIQQQQPDYSASCEGERHLRVLGGKGA